MGKTIGLVIQERVQEIFKCSWIILEGRKGYNMGRNERFMKTMRDIII